MTPDDMCGAFTALVTPFTADASEIDWPAFERLVDDQVKAGISGVVPCGTTGETPTLSDAEQRELIQRTARIAKGRALVIAGTGSNSTKKTIESSMAAVEAGADAVMLVMPYYSKPSQQGLAEHVKQVARAVSVPMVLYNIPGRCGVELRVDTALQLLDACPNVFAIKDATGNVLWCQELVAAAGRRVTVLSGDDAVTVGMMAVGARGVISVTSNVYPAAVAEVVSLMEQRKVDQALALHQRLLPVHRAMFTEPNPQPVKAALARKGLIQPTVRLPLMAASSSCQAEIAAAMDQYEGSR